MADVLWQKAYESVPQTMRNSGLFRIVPIPANTGSVREFSEIDGQEYAKKKDEGDQSQRAQVQQGYSKTMNQYRIALDIGITYEMRTMNKYPEVVARLTNLGRQVANRMDLDLANRITFCTSTTYVDMDGETVSITVGDGFQLTKLAEIKSSLINGENLKNAVRRFKATLNKAKCQLQRLSERTFLMNEAIVRTCKS